MKYREMVKTMQTNSGFSDKESESALQTFVSLLSERLEEGERQDFASQLPAELEEIATAPIETVKMDKEDFLAEIAMEQNVDEPHAKKQMMAAWNTLKDALTSGQINHIKNQLPPSLAGQLH